MKPAIIAHLPFGKSPIPPLRLDFRRTDVDSQQTRLKNRYVLEPEVDWSRYKFNALIDWIKITVRLDKGTDYKAVRRVLKAIPAGSYYAKGVDQQLDGTCRTFDITIQEPVSIASVMAAEQALHSRFGEAGQSVVNALEVSVDIYSRSSNEIERLLMLGILQRSLFTTRDVLTNKRSRARSSRGGGSGETRFLSRQPMRRSLLRLDEAGHQPAWLDGTLYVGAREDDVMIRIMHKIIDKQNLDKNTRTDLENKQKRVRIEVTLQRRELARTGIVTLQDVASTGFGRMAARYFQFKLPTFRLIQKDDLLPVVHERHDLHRAQIFMKAGNLGLAAHDADMAEIRSREWPRIKERLKAQGIAARKFRVGQGASGTAVAYGPLNKRVETALRHLSFRERRRGK